MCVAPVCFLTAAAYPVLFPVLGTSWPRRDGTQNAQDGDPAAALGEVNWSGFLPSTRALEECGSGIISQRRHSGCLDTQPLSSCWYCAQVLVERHFFLWMSYCFWIFKLWFAALSLFINDCCRGKSPVIKNKPWTFALEGFCALALPRMLPCQYAHLE